MYFEKLNSEIKRVLKENGIYVEDSPINDERYISTSEDETVIKNFKIKKLKDLNMSSAKLNATIKNNNLLHKARNWLCCKTFWVEYPLTEDKFRYGKCEYALFGNKINESQLEMTFAYRCGNIKDLELKKEKFLLFKIKNTDPLRMYINTKQWYDQDIITIDISLKGYDKLEKFCFNHGSKISLKKCKASKNLQDNEKSTLNIESLLGLNVQKFVLCNSNFNRGNIDAKMSMNTVQIYNSRHKILEINGKDGNNIISTTLSDVKSNKHVININNSKVYLNVDSNIKKLIIDVKTKDILNDEIEENMGVSLLTNHDLNIYAVDCEIKNLILKGVDQKIKYKDISYVSTDKNRIHLI